MKAVLVVVVLCLVLGDAVDINRHLARRKRVGTEKEVEVKIGAGAAMTCPFGITEGGSLAQGLVVGAEAPDLQASVKIGATVVNVRKCTFHDINGGFVLSCEGGKTKYTADPVPTKASAVAKGECDHIISALAAVTQTYKYELAAAGPMALPLATRNAMISALPGVTIDAIRGAVSLVPTVAPQLSQDDTTLVDAVIAKITQGQPTSNLDATKLKAFFDGHKKVLTAYQMQSKETGYNDNTKSDKQQHDHRVAFENAITNTPSDRNGFASVYEKARRPIYTAQNFDAVPNGAYPDYGKCALHLKLDVLKRSILYTDNTLMYGTMLYATAKGDAPADTYSDLMAKCFAHKADWDQKVSVLRPWYLGNAEVKKRIGFVPTMLFDMSVQGEAALARGALLEYAKHFPKALLGQPHAAPALQSTLGSHVPEALIYGGVKASDVQKITCKNDAAQDTATFPNLAADATDGTITFSFV